MPPHEDNRMSPAFWWRLVATAPLAFGLFCLLTRSWTPLRVGWPIIVLIFVLALIRQGADLYERRRRRQTPHA
jgi:hypothetical protein